MKRGEVWVANLNPSRGREISKLRPILVVHADELLTNQEMQLVERGLRIALGLYSPAAMAN